MQITVSFDNRPSQRSVEMTISVYLKLWGQAESYPESYFGLRLRTVGVNCLKLAFLKATTVTIKISSCIHWVLRLVSTQLGTEHAQCCQGGLIYR